jgi:small subunit ribosomal protein S15e
VQCELVGLYLLFCQSIATSQSFAVLEQKKDAPAGEKPEPVRTHLRNMIIVPEMIGSLIGVYNGKTFNQVEIKPEMIGHYLAEFSISYKPVKHGRPGIGATHSSRFIPLK